MMPNATRNCLQLVTQSTVVSIALAVMLAACGGPATDAETELRDWVSDGQAAAEARERRKLMSMISSAYSDTRGNDRDDINNRFRLYFLRQNTVRLLVSIDDIRVFGDTAAEIDLTAGMAGTNDSALGFSASAYRFELELERIAGDWQLISARWGRLGEAMN